MNLEILIQNNIIKISADLLMKQIRLYNRAMKLIDKNYEPE